MRNHRERLRVLVALSDKLWEDYSSQKILEEEYLQKFSLVKKEINNGFVKSMQDIEMFAKDIGYLVLKSPTKTFLSGTETIIVSKN